MGVELISQLTQIVGEHNVISGEDLKDRYIHIWKMNEPLRAAVLVTPRSTDDVSQVVKLCYSLGQSIAIHGGLTNLVGSTETIGNEVVISLEKMNKILELDEKSRSITVESGVILESVQNLAHQHNLLFPLNFGAKGSAQIGGIISTNAGGLRVLKYGMTRNLVLGIEAVKADGTIICAMKKVIKDNSGYDLKHLFIGSEGTLGIITKAVLRLYEQPKSRVSAYVGFNDYEEVVSFLKYMDAGLSGTLSGFELIWGQTYQAMTSPPALVGPPIPHGFNYYVLVESLGAEPDKDNHRMEQLLAEAFELEMISDAAIATNGADLTWFWTIREDVHVLKAQMNIDQHFDISLPIPLIGIKIKEMQDELIAIDGVIKIFTFGHVADGNIHILVDRQNDDVNLINRINDAVYRKLDHIGGSISAEHGIGVHKKKYLHHSRSTDEIELMKSLKRAMDPKNILNPGKVLDMS